MSPSHTTDAQFDQIKESNDPIRLLISLLDIFPADEDIAAPPGAGEPVAWTELIVGRDYWGQMTGFPEVQEPRKFTVTDINHFPDGGAIIFTEVASWAWGVGASCESAIGPRNRFWTVAPENMDQE